MRPLSFLFAALLGIVLAMIGPALAGPRPQAPVVEPAVQAVQAPALELDLADAAIDAATGEAPEVAAADADAGASELSVEELSRSILEALGTADAA